MKKKKARRCDFKQNDPKNGIPQFEEEIKAHENDTKCLYSWGELKRQNSDLLKCGFDKQPAGMFILIGSQIAQSYAEKGSILTSIYHDYLIYH